MIMMKMRKRMTSLKQSTRHLRCLRVITILSLNRGFPAEGRIAQAGLDKEKEVKEDLIELQELLTIIPIIDILTKDKVYILNLLILAHHDNRRSH